jgi:hypothetical protein
MVNLHKSCTKNRQKIFQRIKLNIFHFYIIDWDCFVGSNDFLLWWNLWLFNFFVGWFYGRFTHLLYRNRQKIYKRICILISLGSFCRIYWLFNFFSLYFFFNFILFLFSCSFPKKLICYFWRYPFWLNL